MISYKDAKQIILQHTEPLETEWVSSDEVVGSVSGATVYSEDNVPPFHNSAMDGFALRHSDTLRASTKAPLELSVLGTIAAGDTCGVERQVSREGGDCWEIMTGASLPADCDSVVKIEDVKPISREGEKRIQLVDSVPFRKNVREAGEDFKKGEIVFAKGQVLHTGHLVALASLGILQVKTFRKPRVAVLSTGRELVNWSEPLGPGQIRNTNGPLLESLLAGWGVHSKNFGVIADSPKVFLERLREVLKWQPDIVISTGAVSVGKFDFVKAALLDMGAEILFHRVAIRPGKPILFGRLGSKKSVLFFGLPGNPISAAVGFRFFVEIAIRKMLALPEERNNSALLVNRTKKPNGLKCFFKAKLSQRSYESKVEILPGQASFMVKPLLKSDCWAVLEESEGAVEANSVVNYVPLWSGVSSIGQGGSCE